MPRRAVALCISVALHGLTAAGLVWFRSDPATEAQRIEIHYVTADSGDQMLPPDDTAPEAGFDAALLRLDHLHIDIARIRTRLGVLFPFLTLDLMFLERIPQDRQNARDALVNPYRAAAGAQAAEAPPLELAHQALQGVIDRAWSRRERWRTFQEMASLLAQHSAHRGRAPELVRGYLDQNILQPYCDGHTRDPRYWAMLENAADHADFIDFVRSFARRSPSSKVTTELLFLLDELAQGSRDVLMMILDTHLETDLTLTRSVVPEGFDLAVAIKERYARWLSERDFDHVAIRRHYDELRLRLLTTIVDTTPDGYRAADATFLAGHVLFEMNRLDDAVRMWLGASPSPGDAYFRAYTEILGALEARPPDRRTISRLLSYEYGRWRVFSIDRLRAFGHRCDTF